MATTSAVTTNRSDSSSGGSRRPPPASHVTVPTRSFAARGLAIAILSVGVAVSLALFAGTTLRGRAARRIEFDRQAASVARAAQASLDVPLEVLRSIPALFGASETVTRAESRVFVQPATARVEVRVTARSAWSREATARLAPAPCRPRTTGRLDITWLSAPRRTFAHDPGDPQIRHATVFAWFVPGQQGRTSASPRS
ncbi:MAG: hypothetical protein JW940_26915 [Polyangiaceae bacterium]|nr:hypothetical protein [Polyangiaceae bacterium]